jgi:hypothetical protein
MLNTMMETANFDSSGYIAAPSASYSSFCAERGVSDTLPEGKVSLPTKVSGHEIGDSQESWFVLI